MAAHLNPIIPGFSPDPSICLIDGTFFLVNSSFHLFPGLPIYMSDDLISWTHIGETCWMKTLIVGSNALKVMP
jgi:beta-xylosidase